MCDNLLSGLGNCLSVTEMHWHYKWVIMVNNKSVVIKVDYVVLVHLVVCGEKHSDRSILFGSKSFTLPPKWTNSA